MVTAEELTVAIKSEGVGETKQDLEGVENTMEDTAEQAGNTAEELEGFTARWQGAISAAVTGLAVGLGALASGVPVLGELMGGVFAVLGALAFQVDQLARQLGVGGFTGVLYDAAAAIYDLEGTAGDLAGVLTVYATIIASVVAGIAAWAVKSFGLVAVLGKIVAAVKVVGAALVGLVGGISATAAALAIAVAAVIAFAAAYLTNFRGVRDKTNQIIGQIVDFVVGGFNTLTDMAMDALGEFGSRAASAFGDIASGISDWASGLASDAYDWGVNLIERFIDGVRSVISKLQNWLGGLRDVGANVGIEVPDLGNIGGGGGGGGGSGGAGFRRPRSRGTGTGGSQIDGRQLTESTGRYRSDPGRRRGL